MIITQTPFRMSFFGGGTDMEDFFKENGGTVLSTTFDKYCYVNVRHLPRFFDYSTELSYAKTERVTAVEDIQHPAIREAMKMLDMHEIRLTYEADLPARSGLGTSSSFAVGMLNMNDCEPLLCFAQQVNGYGKNGDVFLAISTSGNSKNILYAATVAKAKGMKVIGLTGANDSRLSEMADITIRSSHTRTYMIQEHHLPIYHCLCLMLEERFFGE